MSFKLVDDKGSAENRLHKRKRADELLLDDIPSTDYIMSRSGKYCCKVCPQWPVFDTPAMLRNHREGSRHRKNREDLEKANLKKALSEGSREHGCSSVESDMDVLLSSVRQSEMVGSDDKGTNSKRNNESVSKISSVETSNIATCKRKRWTPFFQVSSIAHAEMLKIPNQASGNIFENEEKDLTMGNEVVKKGKNLYAAEGTKCQKIKKNIANHPQKQEKIKRSFNESSKKSEESMEMKLRYYAKMKQNGWIIDGDGKWAKNEDCEFDSDEEPPKFDEFEKWNKT